MAPGPGTGSGVMLGRTVTVLLMVPSAVSGAVRRRG